MKLQSVFFHYGFQECVKKENVNYLKLTEEDYLLMRIYKGDTADLFHAKFHPGDDPCNTVPYWEKSVILGFSPVTDREIIRDFIDKYK